MANGFTHPGMQLTGGRVGKAHLKLGVLSYADRAPGRLDAAFQVVAVTEGTVFEARAGQRTARLDARVEARLDHEDVVVAGLLVDVPGFALNQVTQHVVGYPGAQTAERLPGGAAQRLVKHQRDRIMEAGGGRPQLAGTRINEGAVEKAMLQAGPDRLGIRLQTGQLTGAAAQRHTGAIEHKQLGCVGQLVAQLQQRRLIQLRQVFTELLGNTQQATPLVFAPLLQQPHPRGGEAVEDRFQLRIAVLVDPASPAHGQLAAGTKPRQPATLGCRQIHLIASKSHGGSLAESVGS